MIADLVWYVFGVVSALFFAVIAIANWSKKLLQKNQFASARYDEKRGEWRVCGKYAKIADELKDIREGRKPGAIKYVD